MKRLLFYLKVCKSRYEGLRKELKYTFIVFILSIFLIELYLHKKESFNNFQFDLGRIYLRFCYSFSSAFIFYYIVVYSPRERKRVKSFIYLNNKILLLDKQFEIFLLTVLKCSDLKSNGKIAISHDLMNSLCENINPHLKISESFTGNKTFDDHFKYISFQIRKIKDLTSELLLLNDLLDEEMLRSITNINDQTTNILMFDLSGSNQPNLKFYGTWFYEMHFEIEEMVGKYHKNYRGRYDFQFQYYQRIRNERRK